MALVVYSCSLLCSAVYRLFTVFEYFQRETLTTKIDDYGIGHRWLAVINLVYERQTMQRSVWDGRNMIRLVLLRSHAPQYWHLVDL